MKIVLTCSNVLFVFIYRKAKDKLDDKPVTPAVPPVPPPTQTLPKQRLPQVPEPGTPTGDNPLAPQKLHFWILILDQFPQHPAIPVRLLQKEGVVDVVSREKLQNLPPMKTSLSVLLMRKSRNI